MEYILHNYKVNLSVQPYDSGYTILDFWVRSFARIEDDEAIFYKRYDMIDKKLDIVIFMIQNNLLDINQLDFLLTSFDRCIQRKYSYTNDQLLKMQEIINAIKLQEQIKLNVSTLLERHQIRTNISKDIIIETILSETKLREFPYKEKSSYEELMNYEMLNDQCVYMLHTIPTLVKKKIIK